MNNKSSDYIYTKQYDTGRTVVFRITKNGEQMNLSGLTSIFCLKKPDGNFILRSSVDDELIMTNDTITLELTDQITVLSGKLPYQITLCQNDKEVSTVTGYLMCDRAAIQRDDIESVSDGSLLEDLSVVADAIRDGSVFSGDHVSVTQVQQSGTKIAEITVNDVTTDIYSASGGGTTVQQTVEVPPEQGSSPSSNQQYIPVSPYYDGGGANSLELYDPLRYDTDNGNLLLGDAMDLIGAPSTVKENMGYWVDNGDDNLDENVNSRYQNLSLRNTLHEIGETITPKPTTYGEDYSNYYGVVLENGSQHFYNSYFTLKADYQREIPILMMHGAIDITEEITCDDVERGNQYWHTDASDNGYYSLQRTID